MVQSLINLSPGRLAWLRLLEHELVAHRPSGRVGYDCMHAGLTEWAYREKETGRLICNHEHCLDGWRRGLVARDAYENIGEMLTPHGREVLRGLK